ncbi:MAG: DUF2975 domain-containing protein [Balneolaceae bacterium]
MKTPIKVRLLTWITTAIMVLLVIGMVSTLFASLWFAPRMVPDRDSMSGMASYNTSLSILGNTYTYLLERDSPNGSATEGFYLLNGDDLFRFMPSDSVRYRSNAIDMENSHSSSFAFGLARKQSLNYDGQMTVPILIGHTGIPLDRTSFFRHIQTESFYRILMLIYLFVMVWYLRKFVKKLQNADFFTDENVRNLKVVAFLLILAPFLEFLWSRITAIDYTAPVQTNLLSSGGTDFMFEALFFGLILWVVAWCFGYGVSMQKEQELTI